MELRRNGCAQAILQAHHDGKTVIGICGGFQMMGQEVLDPEHVESDVERMPGLGILPLTTTMNGEKRTVQVDFNWETSAGPSACKGYEIHMGITRPVAAGEKSKPVTTYKESPRCWGSYIHGILDNAPIIDELLSPWLENKEEESAFDYQAYKQQQYDLLADAVRHEINMPELYRILRGE
jgi:adenosylcobyric acid synthase